MNARNSAIENKVGGSMKDGAYTFKGPFSGKAKSLSLSGGAGVASRVGGGARALAKSEAIQGMEKRILHTVKPSVRGSLVKARNAMKNI